ncbi:MAG TPA: hypothetical protein VFH34_02880 [Anaerolineales bacterium]|nr:hypothetical protein [Anaerolineales bacterium]
MNEPAQNTDRFRVFVVALTLLNTIFAAILSGLQIDASIRADQANRDSQYYALLASNEVIRFGHQSAYDLKLLATTTREAQQSLVMQLTALELEDSGENESAAALVSQSDVAQARSDTGSALSVFYTDPRYAPSEPSGLPDSDAYIADLSKAANDFVAQQNAASDEYHKWDNKADSYIAVLSILAIAFFLLGLAQSTVRMRFFFAASALAVMIIAAVWTGLILVS